MIQVIITKSNFVVPHKKVMENCRIQYSITYKISYSSDFKPETPNAIPTTKHTNSPQPPKLLFGSIIKAAPENTRRTPPAQEKIWNTMQKNIKNLLIAVEKC